MADPYAPPGSRRARAPEGEQGRGGGPSRPGPGGPAGDGGRGGPPRGASRRPLPPPRRSTDSRGALRAARLGVRFSLLVLASVVAMSLRLPWSIAGLVFLLAAIVVGVQALVTASRARVRAGALVGLSLGLVVAALLLLAQVLSLAFYPSTAQRERCLEQALTGTARAACQEEYRQGVVDQLSFGR